MIEVPYLTLVAASRNDDHGGNTLYRTQIFVDSFLDRCERHQLRAELILVEWNPPGDWLQPPAVCFHIEHAIGSGFTPENQVPMFERIERQGIGWFDFR